jgi:hypothetical protein
MEPQSLAGLEVCANDSPANMNRKPIVIRTSGLTGFRQRQSGHLKPAVRKVLCRDARAGG